MSSDTPRTDACIAEYREGCLDFAWTLTDLTRQIERALAAMTARAEAAERDAERLLKVVRAQEREIREAASDAASEAGWKHRQGDEYGSW